MATIRERVRAGAALLDKALPDWWNGKEVPTVDLEILNMNSLSMCMLGQCFGSYESGVRKVGVDNMGLSSRDNGFSQLKVGDGGYISLAASWRAEVRRRRKAAGHEA